MPRQMARDYYEVLGLDRTADDAEVKSSFRKLARELHPDVNRHDPEAEEKFKEAAEAYEVLSDPERRTTYDRFGHEGLRSGGWAPETEAFGNFEDVLSAFFGRGDPLFGELFGFGRSGPAPGADVGASVELTLADVLTGAQREITFEAVSRCDRCRGNGAEPGTPIRTCEHCDGAGQVRQVSRTPFGQMVRAAPCPHCGGDGRVAETPCEECSGNGRIVRDRKYEVDVPAGIESGQRIRIAGAGHAGEAGAGMGDLYVEVVVEPDERFERHGQELVSVTRVPATRAMLGGTVEVETLDGPRDLELAPGTQAGERVVLDGLGLPGLRGTSRGDQHVIVDVAIPTRLDDEQRDLVDRLDSSLTPENLKVDKEGGRRRRWRRR